MRIGIDFDNTIVSYDGVFYETAQALSWFVDDKGSSKVGPEKRSKTAVKSWFIERDNEDGWTELQGIVYGKTISQALPYQGLEKALQALKNAGAKMFVVSHKTRYPIIGDKLDFHQAASDWLNDQGLAGYFEDCFFCPEKSLKVARVANLDLNWFVDDLENVLLYPGFPDHTGKIHFVPEQSPVTQPSQGIIRASHWRDIPEIIHSRQITG